MLKKDKQKVIGEQLNDAQVTRFLEMTPYDPNESTDYYILTKAYRGLPADAFERFVKAFIEQGHDIKATNAEGKSFLEEISANTSHPEYVDILKKYGA